MKQQLLALAASLATLGAAAEGADWYFVYDGNSWVTNETTQFQTTDNPEAVVLLNYAITVPNDGKGGIGFQVANKAWTTYYGWSEGSTGIDVVGSTFPMGSVGNCWVTIESGNYDITFNPVAHTIRFDLSASQPDVPDQPTAESWYFVYDGNSWGTDESTQLKPTDTANVFKLDDYAITVPDGQEGLNFQVTNAGWSKIFGWSEGSTGIDKVGTPFPMGSTGNCWVTISSGSYDITFTLTDTEPTILFQASAGIEDVEADSASVPTEIYDLTGRRVAHSQATQGIFILRQGAKVTKVSR